MIDVETIASKWANVYELALPADLEGGYDAANTAYSSATGSHQSNAGACSHMRLVMPVTTT